MAVGPVPVLAQPSTDQDLAEQLDNPVAELISVPFQQNLDFGIRPDGAARSTLNIQPVIPLSLSQGWNLITRTIVPLAYAEGSTATADDTFGQADIVPASSSRRWSR